MYKGRRGVYTWNKPIGNGGIFPIAVHSLYVLVFSVGTQLELEVGLIQTHMTQKPILRVEVGALGARQVKNYKGGCWAGAVV